jgi:serine/threonine protein kinase
MEELHDREGHKETQPIRRGRPEPPVAQKDFGEYRIIEEIGCGGMGWIFKAVHKKLDVIRALKILHSDLSRHDEFVADFKREAQLAAKVQLQHPNIVAIHNTGELEGHHYIDMEFIDGDDLGKRLGPKGMPPLVVSAIAVKILDALDHAHNFEFSYQGKTYYGLIHRDIKPENILINSSGELKITDFGIARGIHMRGDITSGGTVVGTPSYMSPEQIDGSQKISETTDIYSLGALLYELLSGQKAFPGTTTQIIRKISNHEYEPLSKMGTKIPEGIIRIVDKAMSFNPEERYHSAWEMRVEVNKYLSQYGQKDPGTIIKEYFVHGKSPDEKGRTRRPKKKRRWPATVVKLLLAAAVIFVIVLGVLQLVKVVERRNAREVLEASEQNLAQTQLDYASLDFSLPLEVLGLARERFDSTDYEDTRSLSDSATGLCDGIILAYLKEEIEKKYAEVSKKITSVKKKTGSTFDFDGVYMVPARGLIDAQRFARADSLLAEAWDRAEEEIHRTITPPAPPPPRPPDEKETARKKMVNAKSSLAEAKEKKPNLDFSEVGQLIAEAEGFYTKGLYLESISKSEAAGKRIVEMMLPLPPPIKSAKVDQANERYETLSAEQQQELKQDRTRMNRFLGEGKLTQAEWLADKILRAEGVTPLPPAAPPRRDPPIQQNLNSPTRSGWSGARMPTSTGNCKPPWSTTRRSSRVRARVLPGIITCRLDSGWAPYTRIKNDTKKPSPPTRKS